MHIYKTQQERIADLITANANTCVVLRPNSDGQLVVTVLNESDQRLAREKQASAISRLEAESRE